MKNRIFSLLMAVLAVFQLSVAAGARELPQEKTGVCSIDVLIRYNGKNVTDGALTAIRVGYMDQDNGDYFFRRVTDGEKVDDVGSRSSVDAMVSVYTSRKDSFDFYEQTVDIKNGSARFTGLDTGLYLIIQEAGDASTGFYPLSEFLVSVPYWDGAHYQYDVRVTAKTELAAKDPETPGKEPTTVPGSTTGSALPQTGQLRWPVPAMAVCGMLLFAIGWWLTFGGRKDPHEE